MTRADSSPSSTGSSGMSSSTGRGAASLVGESITTARAAGCSGTLVMRGDSAFYSADVVAACRDQDVRFSVTATLDPKVKATIATIDDDAWTPIRYPQAIFDEQAGGWVSDAEVAETSYTAFTSKKSRQVSARLIVRRVKKLDQPAGEGQGELFPAYRYYPIFTDSPYALIQAEEQHRDHAVQEQVNADLIDGPLAHMPSVN
ncbi:transposase [Nonomuraea sp. K274]|uniref:Transposase n=1 Tax=Nonomuraea cypriaca TaxID=1187855 RepID=A0A931AIU6_9ACTN|nr:transposase [Nonomuraea cypriaca]MBF8193666.1 transposase [Nonomuraea cypriaca]